MGIVKQAIYFSLNFLLRKISKQYYKYEEKWHIQLIFYFEKVDMTNF